MPALNKPRVFLDADVTFAGSAAPTEYGSSHVELLMGEITLLDCVTSEQALAEVERNLTAKLPAQLATFRFLVSRCLRVVPDPVPEDLALHHNQADLKDLPILIAALREGCDYLLTFNVRHFKPMPGTIRVQRPGEFLLAVRDLLSSLALNRPER